MNDGRGIPQRVKPVRDKVAYDRYFADHQYCQACGVPAHRAPWPGLSRHHICKPGRSDEPCNLIVICDRDHSLAEGRAIRVDGVLLPLLPLGVILAIKLLRTPDEWDADRLAQLYRRNLPDMEDIPAFIHEEWKRWRG